MSDQLAADLASLKISREGGPPSNKSKFLVYALVTLLIAGGLGVAARWAWPYLMAKLFKTEVSIGEIVLLSPVQSSVELTATGYVVPQTISKLGSKIQGRISQVFVKQGDRVKAGDLLFQLENTEQQSSIRAAQARLHAARSRIQNARANLEETHLQLSRAHKLVQQGAEIASRVEDLEAHSASLKAQVEAANADASAAKAELETLQINLELLRILAPISGTIVTKPPEMGEVVSPLTPLLELIDFSSLVVETDVPESRLDKIKIGMPCEVVLDAFPSKRFRGKILEVIPRINRAKASASVKVCFQDPSDLILPEMAARVNFLNAEPDQKMLAAKPKLFVPKEAIVKRQGSDAVFVVDDDRVKVTPVTVGDPLGEGYELLQGPSAGTKVVKSPPATLSDGEKIKEKIE